MKIVTAKHIYARIGVPSTREQYAYYRNPGEALSIDRILQGTMIDGNSIWYHCIDDGCFYWSGGFEFTQEVLNDNPYTEHNEENWYIYQSAANELLGVYRHIPGFSGLAAGNKTKGEENTKNIALIFYVNSKTEIQNPQVPKFINYRGFKLITDVQILGKVELLRDDPDSELPYLMGGSIGCVKNGKEMPPGTRSLLVEQDSIKYLLTCYHVACANLFENKTYDLLDNEVKVNIPSTSTLNSQNVISSKVAKGGFGSNYDYALVEMGENIKYFDNYMPKHFFKAGFYTLSDLKNLNKGIKLCKYGISTKYTTGELIKAYPANDILVSTSKKLYMSNLIVADISCRRGDSGSPVVDDTGKILGFIVAAEFKGLDSIKTFIAPFAHLYENKHIKPFL